ncbi:MAG: putative bacteriophage protein Gp37/Gp68 [Candidatus Woesebacteria bacterium GW2011_GWA1_39_11b]|nr:MAG: putative bacteriophage protein Gp37/Gp68 [Candidatus Woesebacteria bacterium GW2011_GWA1_39_11b]KKS77103.1 MAG: putative bacteriophage protein Gp37/Gp68 [Candidatus Woesebacteria bacterium GW2011_GWC1_42_9]
MGKTTNISWTDATVNFWTGCKKVSDGCRDCYMFRDKKRWGQDPNKITLSSDATFYAALKWKDPKRIFTCSWSDFFLEEADAWRNVAWQVIKNTPQHTWQILTKRPERIGRCLPDDWGRGYKNVQLGVTVESSKHLDRIPYLIYTPAAVHFISLEPLIDMVDLSDFIMPCAGKRIMANIDWVIVGGESGRTAREMKLKWAEIIIKQCRETNVPIFVKQMGAYTAHHMGMGNRAGSNIEEWPEHLRIQQMPKI